MLLRTLWSRLAVQGPLEKKPVCMFVSARLSQSVHQHKYESQTRTLSAWSDPRTGYSEAHHTSPTLPALRGFSLHSTLLTDPRILTKCWSVQGRLYSSDLVKSVLKPSLKPVTVPGKRVPKGPRTKQPSRANQPSLKEDKVLQPIIGGVIDVIAQQAKSMWTRFLIRLFSRLRLFLMFWTP